MKDSIIRIETRNGETIDLIRPDPQDDLTWMHCFYELGNAASMMQLDVQARRQAEKASV